MVCFVAAYLKPVMAITTCSVEKSYVKHRFGRGRWLKDFPGEYYDYYNAANGNAAYTPLSTTPFLPVLTTTPLNQTHGNNAQDAGDDDLTTTKTTTEFQDNVLNQM